MHDIQQKVDSLLRQMTLEEKVAQMIQFPYLKGHHDYALKWAKMGAGSFLHVLGDDARDIQRAATTQTRLGIPVLFGIDAIHGHGLNDHATIFPTQLALACSWDTALAEEMGRVTAREVATDGLHWTFSPVLCLGRDTRWGRVNETFGEAVSWARPSSGADRPAGQVREEVRLLHHLGGTARPVPSRSSAHQPVPEPAQAARHGYEDHRRCHPLHPGGAAGLHLPLPGRNGRGRRPQRRLDERDLSGLHPQGDGLCPAGL